MNFGPILILMTMTRDILKLKAIRSGNADIWRKFKKIRNSTNNEVKLAKKVYFENALKEYRGDFPASRGSFPGVC